MCQSKITKVYLPALSLRLKEQLWKLTFNSISVGKYEGRMKLQENRDYESIYATDLLSPINCCDSALI